MTADFIHYAHACSCSFTYESFVFSYVQSFCEFIYSVCMNCDIYFTRLSS